MQQWKFQLDKELLFVLRVVNRSPEIVQDLQPCSPEKLSSNTKP